MKRRKHRALAYALLALIFVLLLTSVSLILTADSAETGPYESDPPAPTEMVETVPATPEPTIDICEPEDELPVTTLEPIPYGTPEPIEGGDEYALDPLTGDVAITEDWIPLDIWCGCNDPYLAEWDAFVYHSEIPLAEDLQCILWNDCLENGVPYDICLALIQTESGFQIDADNGICHGLFQLHKLYYSPEVPVGEHIGMALDLIGDLHDSYGDWGEVLTRYAYGHHSDDRRYANLIFERAAYWESVCHCCDG